MNRGLLGLLLVVVILGGGAAIAVSSLGGSSSVTLPPEITTTVAAGTTTSGPGGPAPVGGAGLVAACRADVQSVESAVQLFQAQNGTWPPDLAALVPSWLRSPPSETHYTIYLDGQGHVGVYPPGSNPSGGVAQAADVGLHPELCLTVPR